VTQTGERSPGSERKCPVGQQRANREPVRGPRQLCSRCLSPPVGHRSDDPPLIAVSGLGQPGGPVRLGRTFRMGREWNEISKRSWKIQVWWKFRWIPVHLIFREARNFQDLFPVGGLDRATSALQAPASAVGRPSGPPWTRDRLARWPDGDRVRPSGCRAPDREPADPAAGFPAPGGAGAGSRTDAPAGARTCRKIWEDPGFREDQVRPGTPFFPRSPDPSREKLRHPSRDRDSRQPVGQTGQNGAASPHTGRARPCHADCAHIGPRPKAHLRGDGECVTGAPASPAVPAVPDVPVRRRRHTSRTGFPVTVVDSCLAVDPRDYSAPFRTRSTDPPP
jgi:hypothetical protein